MARSKSTVYLGYEDDEITPKHGLFLNSTINKIGGTPDWPSGDIKVPACTLCGTARPLIVQLYAPLEHSQFHRSLYVFACLNPACSQNSKSWLCIRTQHLDTQSQADLMNAIPAVASTTNGKHKKKQQSKQVQKINWCSGVNDWGDVAAPVEVSCEKMDTAADDEQEENGNELSKIDNLAQDLTAVTAPSVAAGAATAVAAGITNQELAAQTAVVGAADDEDEDDDESASMENDLMCGLAQIDLNPSQNANDDPNANCAAGVDNSVIAAAGILGAAATATICAEIEGSETDVVLVETPKKPERDLIALLKHTSTPAALGPLAKITDVTLKPYYMSVDLEQRSVHDQYEHYGGTGALSADHIRELYQDYNRQDEAAQSPISGNVAGVSNGGSGVSPAGDDQEGYEKALPAHGDLIFYKFITTIQQNPDQILRYSRDTLPLLIAPLTEPVPKCPHCNGDTICEVQILSTLIPRLRLQQNGDAAPLEYGNVLIFTCLKSCWDTPDKLRYERVLVQTEL